MASSHFKELPSCSFSNFPGEDYAVFRTTILDFGEQHDYSEEEIKIAFEECMRGEAKKTASSIDHDCSLRFLLNRYDHLFLPSNQLLRIRKKLDLAIQQKEETLADFHLRIKMLWKEGFPEEPVG